MIIIGQGFWKVEKILLNCNNEKDKNKINGTNK